MCVDLLNVAIALKSARHLNVGSCLAQFSPFGPRWRRVRCPPDSIEAGPLDSSVRGFGSFIAVTEIRRKSAQIPQSAGLTDLKKAETKTGPRSVTRLKNAEAEGMVYPGRLRLYDVDTDKVYLIVTDQGDSEVLLVEAGVVYYRVNDRLYSAPITDAGIGRAQLLATSPDIITVPTPTGLLSSTKAVLLQDLAPDIQEPRSQPVWRWRSVCGGWSNRSSSIGCRWRALLEEVTCGTIRK